LKPSRSDPVLVLASASPRRQDLLRNAGIPYTACPANVPESLHPGEMPEEFALRLAREKAAEVWGRLQNADDSAPPRFVLGADTIVLVDNAVLGKPENAEDAKRMLRLLSGRSHLVLTAVCLMGAEAATGNIEASFFEDTRSENTRVFFDPVSEKEIQGYVAHGEPMDKAGAYAIQGIASKWIGKIEGDYSNVVGLPVRLVYQMLREHGAMQ
jgi:septum formation protein